ncbi:hypothetical protein Poli38472_010089 [Pythium oligandrum]|uniref:Uncharacterized protein n=1 Tax=Pythium oligandrum TaxID=41045 RepID=A0A8K1FCP3_PYTOL|nr:hypothetical protein Poli38472_010089 [Pythium oligandrum]|eukprot:TMW58530.1 hypothetical protein Poli38472_010089 [Pythium oligandrum]
MAPNFKMMAVTFGLVTISNAYLDASNPTHLLAVRVLYALSQIACYGMLAFIYYKSMNNTEPGTVTMKEDLGFGQEGETEVKVTISEHDMRMCRKEIQRYAIGSVITVFIHYKWGFFPPLLIQAVTQPFNLYQTALVKVALLGERSWGELRRPWQDPTTLGKQWEAWNDTVQSALTGEPIVRQSKKASKKAAGKRKAK